MSCEACRTIPPVIAQGYTPKGQYETIAGLNTYVTGKTDGRVGIVHVYDVFGLANQTLQGADLLAARLNAVVLVPDFFKGDALEAHMIPADTDEKKKRIGSFLATSANVERNLGVLLAAVPEYRVRFPSVNKWGANGLCWGGKMTILASGFNTPFAASSQCHPGLMDAADAQSVAIPHLVLASKDEAPETVAAYRPLVAPKGGAVETYSTMWHGWMGARADLEKEESRAEYVRGYTQLADFFEKHLA
ncbi:hypothetical protein N7509_012796 [Penicillium cosmopolitanum]|uniref:Dienelactone hydrolase domain-containing protein n=1 Tax=Penicillium cosmopolitanum TaxID=1131564 RepID=A0A9W9VDV9_9EURO|nr:uncharacterized protein N7509_012796 [Penicillium cosmopolitanum]KAJ5375910.1 hypothetical protein N7509_012796 [Penicillium cosmopolitanum]